MTGLLNILGQTILGAKPNAISEEEQNVLRFPGADPSSVLQGVLLHTDGGLTDDATSRPRVSALLGPGATVRGLAATLVPTYAKAAAATGGAPAPTADQLAHAILNYNGHYIPTTAFADFRAGLRLPLPIEIDVASSSWIVDANAVRTLADASSDVPPWWIANPVPLLETIDAAELPAVVSALFSEFPAQGLWATELTRRILTNPFAAVFELLEALRQAEAKAAGGAFALALEIVDPIVDHQAALLASTSGGSGILRRLSSALATPPSALGADDKTRLARVSALLDGALWTTAGGVKTRTPFVDLPQTAGQKADRGKVSQRPKLSEHDQRGGVHLVVFGREVGVGPLATDDIGGAYSGPADAGRVRPQDVAAEPLTSINASGSPPLAARLEIVFSIAESEGWIDAVRQRDLAILSVGVHQWSVHVDNELLALLSRFKALDPAAFDLHVTMYGMDVEQDPARPGQFLLISISDNGDRTELATPPQRARLLGGTPWSNPRTFDGVWAARFRLIALASVAYRRAQLLEATGRFDRIVKDAGSVAFHNDTYQIDQLVTSKYGAALILDAHINDTKKFARNLQLAVSQAASHLQATVTDDVRDQTICAKYHDLRLSNDNLTRRNQIIDTANLDTAHGSFIGWSL